MTPMRWAWAVVVMVAATMGVRLASHPMEAYGDSAAQYIEHLARLRMLERLREGVDGGPLAKLVALDGLYPPGLHLVESAWGGLVGHAASHVLWLGFGWWLLLAWAVAVLGRRLVADVPLAGPACFVAMALVPATQATALRSYYDLPMTALLWMALAVLSGTARWRGVWAGLLLVAAVLIKWTALPYGVVMVVAWGVVTRPEAVRPPLVALGLLVGWTAVFLAAGAESFFTMGGATFQPAPGVSVDATGSGPVRWLAVAGANLGRLGVEQVVFYPVRLVTTVLSPVGALVVGFAVSRLWRGQRQLLALVGLIALGHLVFLLLLVPIQDDRFILTLVPGMALLGGVGLLRSGRLAVGAVMAMVLVSLDAHLWTPEPVAEGDVRSEVMEGRSWQPRLGMSSSLDRRGWSRSSDMRDDRAVLRERLWSTLAGCGGGVVAASDRLITGTGDLNWWTYRRVLGGLEGEAAEVRWSGEPGSAERPPRLWVVASGPAAGTDTAPAGWSEVGSVVGDSGRSAWKIWGPRAGVECR